KQYGLFDVNTGDFYRDNKGGIIPGNVPASARPMDTSKEWALEDRTDQNGLKHTYRVNASTGEAYPLMIPGEAPNGAGPAAPQVPFVSSPDQKAAKAPSYDRIVGPDNKVQYIDRSNPNAPPIKTNVVARGGKTGGNVRGENEQLAAEAQDA